MGSSKTIGTPVRCPACRHQNLAIDIWCERCGRPLDWKPTEENLPARRPVQRVPEGSDQYCWSCGAPNGPGDRHCGECGEELGAPTAPSVRSQSRPRLTASARSGPVLALPALALPRIKLPRWQAPQLRIPHISLAQIRPPHLPRTVLLAGLVLAVLLIVPLIYLVSPAAHQVAARQSTGSHLPATSAGQAKNGSPEAVAIAAVQAKTGFKYSATCRGTAACLSVTGQTIGQGAAAFVFSTAHSAGRECVSYLVQKNGAWQPLGSVVCALPNQVSPLVGRDATVHVSRSCANVHASPSLKGGVVTCLFDGTTVHVAGGPVYADGFVWWQTSKGWIAHDFLVAP